MNQTGDYTGCLIMECHSSKRCMASSYGMTTCHSGALARSLAASSNIQQNLARALLVQRRSETAAMPARATPGAIGYDVFADLPNYPNGLVIPAGCRKLIPLGFSMRCPDGTYGRLAPRSGLALKKGIDVLAGVIDQDYRGVVHVLLANTSHAPVTIDHGERCAQLILERAEIAPVTEVDNLPDAIRGEGGFGSTG